MKAISITLVLLFFSLTKALSQRQTDSLLFWGKEKLVWNDFKGKIDNKSYLFAKSFIGIRTEGVWKNNLPFFKVICYFNKNRSWVKDTTFYLLLKHEQLHFDICEIFARIMNRELMLLRANGETNLDAYYLIIQKLLKDNLEYQNLYDIETKHGTIIEKQKEWDTKIEEELKKLEEYKIDYSKYFREGHYP